MLHHMKLNKSPFDKIFNGEKKIELRLNDEKRQQVKEGDFIEFTQIGDEKRKMTVLVLELHHFDSFKALFATLPKEKIGHKSDEIISDDYMDKYYTPEKQEQYGALGIEIRMTELQRFIDAQNYGYSFGENYQTALAEIRNGKKETHWMWYIFPQIKGLGFSEITSYFSIQSLSEAKDYISHDILRERLVEICEALMSLETNDPMVVFGNPDAFKLRSCMTLFIEADPEITIFQQVLDKFCMGSLDDKTINLLGKYD